MVATLEEDFIVMARAKGLTTARILTRHALRPSTFTLMTVAGLQVGGLITGAVIVESVFQLNGLGLLLTHSVSQHDYPTIQAITVIVAVTYIVINVLIDSLYLVIDPRIRRPRHQLTTGSLGSAPGRRSARPAPTGAIASQGSRLGVLGRRRLAHLDRAARDLREPAPAAGPEHGQQFLPQRSARSRAWCRTHTRVRRQLERDVLSRVIFGARVSLVVGFASISIGLLVGGTLGLIAGFFRGPFDEVMNVLTNAFLSFPYLVLALAVVAFLGNSLFDVTLIIAILAWPLLFRVVRAATIEFGERDYVLAARALGSTRGADRAQAAAPRRRAGRGHLRTGRGRARDRRTRARSRSSASPVPDPTSTWGKMIAEGSSDLTQNVGPSCVAPRRRDVPHDPRGQFHRRPAPRRCSTPRGRPLSPKRHIFDIEDTDDRPLLEVTRSSPTSDQATASCARSMACRSPCSGARRSASSASPDPARPCSRGR